MTDKRVESVMRNVVIIGAGLSGLSLGAALSKEGFGVTIVEKEAFVGGLARSFERDGCVFDIGPHIFFGKRLICRLREYFRGKDILIQNNGLKQGIYIRDKVFRYPFQLKEILARIEKKRLPLVIYDVLLSSKKSRKSQHRSDESLEEWVKTKIGATLFDYIELNTYVEKLYGISAAEISSDWGKQRLKQLAKLSFWQAVNRSFNPFAKKAGPYAFYCSKGIGGIALAFADYIREKGGNVIVDAMVEKVNIIDEKVYEIDIKQGTEYITISGDYFVSCARVSDLVRMFRPQRSDKVRDASAMLRYRALVILYVVVDRPMIFDHCLIYYSTKGTTFKRIAEFKHFSPELSPNGSTSIAVEICVDREDRLWKQADQQIFEGILAELERLGILNGKDVVSYFTVRVPSAYPIYFMNYMDSLGMVLGDLSKIENLVSLGRQGLYQHDNMPTSIESGLNLADLITSHSRGDMGKINRIVYEGRIHKYDGVQ